LFPRRTAADHCRYDESAVDLMRFIQGAQRLALRLADIRQLVELRRTGECPCGPAATLVRQGADARAAEVSPSAVGLLGVSG
jgi:DNA-binding transcriptional MerR regulator